MKLNPCRCGADIDQHFRVELVSRVAGYSVFACSCIACNKIEAFAMMSGDDDAIMRVATQVWNRANPLSPTMTSEQVLNTHPNKEIIEEILRWENGDVGYIKHTTRVVGRFVGRNPCTCSLVFFDEETAEYKSFHAWQVERREGHE